MRWRWTFLLPVALLVGATGCYEMGGMEDELAQLRSDHDALKAEYDRMKGELRRFIGEDGSDPSGLYKWGLEAGHAMCDIIDANGPDSKYDAATLAFCGPSDPPPNEPPEPPDWGD